MKKYLLGIAVVIVLVGVGWYVWSGKVETGGQTPPASSASSYKDGTYSIDGTPVTLKDGHAETEAAPGSASKITTTYFGNEATGDLNGDGKPDVAFILTQSMGGSGTFYYVAVALKTAAGYQGTNAILLGDRIAPQTTEIRGGQLIVNYADRNPGEAMTVRPSLGVSKYLTVTGAVLSVAAGAGPGEHCGGNMTTAKQCVLGYHCAPNPASHLPFGDVGGLCVKD